MRQALPRAWGRGETDFRHPHPPGLIHRVHAAAAACGQLFGREEQPALWRALHPAEGAVGSGGVGHAIVDGVSRPAGKILRQRVLLAPLLKEIAAILGAGQVAPHPVGQISGHFPLLGPQGNGPAREVSHKIRQRHGAVHGTVAVGSGIVQQHEIRQNGIIVPKAPQAHPDPHGVSLARTRRSTRTAMEQSSWIWARRSARSIQACQQG